MEDIKIRIVEEQKGQRIDKILAKELADFSRTQIQSLIQNGYVVIDECIYVREKSANYFDNILR